MKSALYRGIVVPLRLGTLVASSVSGFIDHPGGGPSRRPLRQKGASRVALPLYVFFFALFFCDTCAALAAPLLLELWPGRAWAALPS